MTSYAIDLEKISKSYADVVAMSETSLSVGAGEFFSILGPSGCGKSTTLRLIAGFESPTTGRVRLRGEDVTDLPPAKRDVNMVFQAYALFPHMTVLENVAFGLRVKKVGRREAARRVGEALATVRLTGMDTRRPGELSGGQQQRVALARALVNNPGALLLDEPLGALDLKLRKEMQLELKAIQEQSRTTFIYVTHDQDEALTMSDRIAVVNGGVVEQIAAPRELYEHPATAFVAGFIGTSNLLHFRVDEVEGDTAVMRVGESERILARVADRVARGASILVTVRPEKISLAAGRPDVPCSWVHGTVREVIYLGSTTQTIVELPNADRLSVHRLSGEKQDDPAVGDQAVLSWPVECSYVIDREQALARTGAERPHGETLRGGVAPS